MLQPHFMQSITKLSLHKQRTTEMVNTTVYYIFFAIKLGSTVVSRKNDHNILKHLNKQA